jgi:hypothetical protein
MSIKTAITLAAVLVLGTVSTALAEDPEIDTYRSDHAKVSHDRDPGFTPTERTWFKQAG